jgi:hypothetical protein
MTKQDKSLEVTKPIQSEADALIAQAIDKNGYRPGMHPNSRLNLEKGKHIGAKKDRNVNWKGKSAGYSAFHHWLKRNFGKASLCENPSCIYPRKIRDSRISTKMHLVEKPSMFHWALIKGKQHEQKRESYIQLCVSCHAKYDKNSIEIKI